MIDNKTIRQVVINKTLLPCTPGELEYQEAATAVGGYSVSFTTNVEGAVQDFVTVIEPKQSGSGDPSPDNVRPITGVDTLSFLHGIITTPPVSPTGISVPLGQTVYGGEVDVVGGEVSNKYGSIDLSTLSWTYHAASGQYNEFFDCYLPDDSIVGYGNVAFDGYCSIYKSIRSADIAKTGFDDDVMALATNTRRFIVCDQRYHSKNDFVAGIDGVILVYPLATPTTAQITPVTLNTLKGRQKLQSTDKFGFSLKYPIMVGGSCELAKQFLPIFYPNGKGVKHHGSTF